MMQKFDVQINFTLYDKSENEAIFNLQKFLKEAIIHYGLDNIITDHDLLEFIGNEHADSGEAVKERSGARCGDNHNCQGKPVQCCKQACHNSVQGWPF